MRYTQLKAFYHVAVQGGFSRAAEHLNQSQPSLSDHVRQLESDHDVRLFDRRHRRVELTPAGEELFLLAREFFDVEERISEYLDQSSKALKGRLRIMADSPAHITSLLKKFSQTHPEVQIELTTGNSAEVLERLRHYDAEIGIFVSGGDRPDLLTRPLGAAPIVALATQAFLEQYGYKAGQEASLKFSDLVRFPLIFRESGSQTQTLVIDAARRQGIRLKSAMVVDGREAMRNLVAEGFGIGFASAAEIGADSHLEQISIAETGLDMPETLACLAVRKNQPMIRAFLTSLDSKGDF